MTTLIRNRKYKDNKIIEVEILDYSDTKTYFKYRNVITKSESWDIFDDWEILDKVSGLVPVGIYNYSDITANQNEKIIEENRVTVHSHNTPYNSAPTVGSD